MCLAKHNQNNLKIPKLRAVRFTANTTNDVNQTVVLHAYWAGKKGKYEVQRF